MATRPLGRLLQGIDSLVAARTTSDTADADLLARFLTQRDEAAFTALVKRHGPMVHAVSRRVLGSDHDAEDVLQATFLLLALKAATVRKRGSVASWLFGTAYRLARRARQQRTARTARERKAAAMRDPSRPAADAWKELREVLDEALAGLPEKYRAALVLCYLEGKTQEQAARQLNCPLGTVRGRLARGRVLLRRRLARRGLTLSAGTLAAGLLAQAAAAGTGRFPTMLLQPTTTAAVKLAAGCEAAGFVSAEVAGLFKMGLAMLTTAKLKAATILFLAVAVVTAGAGLGAAKALRSHRPAAAAGPQSPPETPTQPPPREPPPRTDRFGDPLPAGVVARMGSGRMRHADSFRLAFSPDGKSLVTTSRSSLRIWAGETGKLRRRLDLKADWTSNFAFTDEGIAVAGMSYADRIVHVQVWDPDTGRVRRQLAMNDRPELAHIAFSPGGKLIACRYKGVRIYDSIDGRERLHLPVADARDFAFAPDGRTIAICNITDTVYLYDTKSGAKLREWKRDGDKVVHIFFSPDGRYLATVPWEDNSAQPGQCSIWDVATGKELHRLQGPDGYVLCVAFSPDGRYVATGCQHPELVLWDLSTGKGVRRFPTAAFFSNLAFSRDGSTLAALSGGGTIMLWDVATGRVLPGSADPSFHMAYNLHFTPDGKQLINAIGPCLAWDPITGREVRRFATVPHVNPYSLRLSPDQTLLAATDHHGAIHLCDAATGKEVRQLQGHDRWTGYLVFSADSRRLYSRGADSAVREWDVATGREVHCFTGYPGTSRLAASPDRRWLASIQGREVVLWDLAAGKERNRFPLVNGSSAKELAFSADNRLLAVSDAFKGSTLTGGVRLWDVATANELGPLGGHKLEASSLTFSPDGRTLATGSFDGGLFLWELSTLRLRHQFTGHESAVRSLAFSPDGRWLAASSLEAPVYVWDVAGMGEGRWPRPSRSQLERLWADLAGEDAAVAFRAIHRLRAAPGAALPFIRSRLKPVASADPEHVRRLVAALDKDVFAERQQAAAQLEQLGDSAVKPLRETLRQPLSPEVRRRLQAILNQATGDTPSRRQTVRSVELVEAIGTPEAATLIAEWARGAPGACLTREASLVADRLRLRKVHAP